MAAQNANTVSEKLFRGFPTSGFPFSQAELAKEMGRGPLRSFLQRLAVRDVVWVFDDFTGKAIDSTVNWAVANGGGAAVASFAINVQSNGIIRGTTGTANGTTASASLIGPIIYLPSTNPFIEIRYKFVTAITSVRFEVGFIDAVPASNTAGFNSMDTPTAFATNAATVGIDTSATANKLNLFTVGNATNQAVKVTAGTVGLATAGTYQTIRLHLYSRDDLTNGAVDAAMWVDGVRQATADTSATAGVGIVNAATLLAPWVYVEAINATSKSLDIDYIMVGAQRIT